MLWALACVGVLSSEWRIIWFGHRIIDSVKYRITNPVSVFVIRPHKNSWFGFGFGIRSHTNLRFGFGFGFGLMTKQDSDSDSWFGLMTKQDSDSDSWFGFIPWFDMIRIRVMLGFSIENLLFPNRMPNHWFDCNSDSVSNCWFGILIRIGSN